MVLQSCVKTFVGERTKSTREKKAGNKSVSWGGETRAVSHEKTSLEGIIKRSHVDKRYARNGDESNQVPKYKVKVHR